MKYILLSLLFFIVFRSFKLWFRYKYYSLKKGYTYSFTKYIIRNTPSMDRNKDIFERRELRKVYEKKMILNFDENDSKEFNQIRIFSNIFSVLAMSSGAAGLIFLTNLYIQEDIIDYFLP